ncbi:MAG: branched-chain amino acid ABC transporter permease [Acidimicrobiales bacterium]
MTAVSAETAPADLLRPAAAEAAFRDPFLPSKRARGTSWVVLFALLAAFPLVFTNPAVTSIGVFTMMFLVAAIGWNIFSGYSGYVSIGHAIFYGFGQYTVAEVILHWHITPGVEELAVIPLAGIVAAIVAVPVGLILLRVRKHTFIVLTIAAMFIFQLLAFNFSGFTGGSAGTNVASPPWSGTVFNVPFYYVGLGGAIVALLVSWGVRRSKYGLGLLAIRDDEDRAKGLGIRVTRTKLIAYVISAVFVGIAGGIYAPFVGAVFPQFGFDPSYDLALAVMVFVGGLGTLPGPVLGALVLAPVQQYFQLRFGASTLYLIVYGVLFIVILLTLPVGVVPSISDRYRSWMAARWRRREEAGPVEGTMPITAPAGSAGIDDGGAR